MMGHKKRHFECRYTIFKPLFTGQTYDDHLVAWMVKVMVMLLMMMRINAMMMAIVM